MDEDLTRLIKSWRAPSPSTGFDRRMVSVFRGRARWWQRWWAVRIEVPLPALAAVLVVVLFLGTLLVRGRFDRPAQAGGWQPVAEPTLKVIREVRQ
jgi:hypothetical protein